MWTRAGEIDREAASECFYTCIVPLAGVPMRSRMKPNAHKAWAKAVDDQDYGKAVSCSGHERLSRQQLFADAESRLGAGKPKGAPRGRPAERK